MEDHGSQAPDSRQEPPRRKRSARHRLARWTFVGIVLFATALFSRLGVWQLNRLAQRKAANAARRARQARPPLGIPGGLALARLPRADTGALDSAVEARSDSLTWRSARLRGRFDWRREVVLRDRSFEGEPGVYVITPFLVRQGDDSLAIPVLRGWLPASDAYHAPLLAGRPDSAGMPGHGGETPRAGAASGGNPASGAASGGTGAGRSTPDSVRVLLLRVPGVRARQVDTLVAPDGPHPVLGHLDTDVLARLLPYPVADLYAQRTDSAGGRLFPVRVALPELTNGPHLSYAIQWFAFAVISVAGGIIFWREGGVG